MAVRMQVYKCAKCGNVVEVLRGGGGELVCCSSPMELLEEKKADSSVEKHVPFIKKEGSGYIVKVGRNALHPMEEKHYIDWIELVVDGIVYRKFLSPGGQPEAFFAAAEGREVSARELCNIHGLWVSE